LHKNLGRNAYQKSNAVNVPCLLGFTLLILKYMYFEVDPELFFYRFCYNFQIIKMAILYDDQMNSRVVLSHPIYLEESLHLAERK
jgi:hypothetical protein